MLSPLKSITSSESQSIETRPTFVSPFGDRSATDTTYSIGTASSPLGYQLLQVSSAKFFHERHLLAFFRYKM